VLRAPSGRGISPREPLEVPDVSGGRSANTTSRASISNRRPRWAAGQGGMVQSLSRERPADVMETAEHREPYESRGSRTGLGAPGGESPLGDSTRRTVRVAQAERRLWVQKGDRRDARGFCIRNHVVMEEGCRFNWLYTRVVPSHAIQLAAVYLDRNVRRILAGHPKARPNAEHEQELASMVHLCGAGATKAFAKRGFRLVAGNRCGEHDLATYLARVKVIEREFVRLASIHRPKRFGAF